MLGRSLGQGRATGIRAGWAGRGLRPGEGSAGCWASSAHVDLPLTFARDCAPHFTLL